MKTLFLLKVPTLILPKHTSVSSTHIIESSAPCIPAHFALHFSGKQPMCLYSRGESMGRDGYFGHGEITGGKIPPPLLPQTQLAHTQ